MRFPLIEKLFDADTLVSKHDQASVGRLFGAARAVTLELSLALPAGRKTLRYPSIPSYSIMPRPGLGPHPPNRDPLPLPSGQGRWQWWRCSDAPGRRSRLQYWPRCYGGAWRPCDEDREGSRSMTLRLMDTSWSFSFKASLINSTKPAEAAVGKSGGRSLTGQTRSTTKQPDRVQWPVRLNW